MRAFLKFIKGMMSMPVHVQLWVMLLGALNMIAPFFFLEHLEAKIVLGVFMASAMLMMILTAASGFTRLLGLGHVLWIPLLIYLWTRLGQHPATDAFGYWLRGLMVVNAISLVIDIRDVVLYLKGDRAETVEGL